MRTQARRSRKNSRVPYLPPHNPPSLTHPFSLSPSLYSSVSLFHPFRSCFFTHSPCAFRETSPAPRPWRPLSVVKLPHETFLMSNHGDLRPSLSSSLSISPSRLSSSSLSPAPLRLPSLTLFLFKQLFLFLAVRSSVFLPFRTFADLYPTSPVSPPTRHPPRGLFSEGRFSLFCFSAGLPPPDFVADARTTAMVAATLAIVRRRSAECRITSGCDAINARIMLNIARLSNTGERLHRLHHRRRRRRHRCCRSELPSRECAHKTIASFKFFTLIEAINGHRRTAASDQIAEYFYSLQKDYELPQIIPKDRICLIPK